MIYALWGQDSFRLHKAYQDMTAAHTQRGCTLSVYDQDQCEFHDILSQWKSNSLFQERQCLVLKNVGSQEDIFKGLQEHADMFSKDEENVLLLVQEGKEFAKKKWQSFLSSYATSNAYPLLNPQEFRTWVHNQLKESDISLDRVGFEHFLNVVNGDSWHAFHEIQKFISYGKQHLTRADVNLLMATPSTVKVFALMDALLARERKKAFHALHSILESGENPVALLSLLQGTMRNAIQIRELISQGIPSSRIASLLGIHPFVAMNTSRLARSMSVTEAERIYKKLFRIELFVKTGKQSPSLALDFFFSEV